MRRNLSIFVVLFLGIFGFSFCMFLKGNRHVSRILLYYALSNSKKVMGVRVGFAGFTKNKVSEEIHHYLRVMLDRPPNIFFRTLFEGNVDIDVVHVVDSTIHVGLSCTEKITINESDITLLREGINKNFPYFTAINFLWIRC